MGNGHCAREKEQKAFKFGHDVHKYEDFESNLN